MPSLSHTLAATALQRTAIGSIAMQAENDPALFEELVSLVGDEDDTVAWHAAWALEQVSRRRPELLERYRKEISRRAVTEPGHGVQRLLLSIVNRMPMPADIDTELFDFCLEGMHSPRLSIAVRALCIKIACRICVLHKPLAEELRLHLEYGDEESLPTGVATARRNALRELERHSTTKKKDKKGLTKQKICFQTI